MHFSMVNSECLYLHDQMSRFRSRLRDICHNKAIWTSQFLDDNSSHYEWECFFSFRYLGATSSLLSATANSWVYLYILILLLSAVPLRDIPSCHQRSLLFLLQFIRFVSLTTSSIVFFAKSAAAPHLIRSTPYDCKFVLGCTWLAPRSIFMFHDQPAGLPNLVSDTCRLCRFLTHPIDLNADGS
jgi:hypothetical protein